MYLYIVITIDIYIYILYLSLSLFLSSQACVTDQEMLAEHEDIDNVQLFAQHFHGLKVFLKVKIRQFVVDQRGFP